MTIQIPKDISEVTPQLCRQVFTEIVGGVIDDDNYNSEEILYLDGERLWLENEDFQPFTRSQDTKLCDRWLEENELSMTINKNPDAVNGEYLFEVLIYNDVDFRKMNVQVYAELEPFARMVSIILAFNKLEEK